MRVAVIGCGSAGRRHIGNLLQLGCEVWAFDPSEEAQERAAAEHPGCVHPDSPDNSAHLFFESLEYDAVIIASPYDWHLKWADYCVHQRVPIFVEKPLGALDQIEDWRRLIQESAGLTTQVGYQCRFHPKARALKLLFPNPIGGHFSCFLDMATWPGKSYGPFLLEAASHEIDMALWLGAPANVASVEVVGPLPTTRVAFGESRLWLWRFECGDGRPNYYRSWDIQGDFDTGVEVTFCSPEELGGEMYRLELQHFLECVREGKPTDVPLSDGLRVLEVVQQIEQMTKVAV